MNSVHDLNSYILISIIYLSTCLPACLPTYIPTYPPIYLHVCMYVCMYVCILQGNREQAAP